MRSASFALTAQPGLSGMRSAEAGFSLLEAMVAVAILSGGLIAALEIQSGNARREAAVLSRSQALLTAEALMAEVQAGLHPPPVDLSGVTEAGVSWRLNVAAMEPARPSKAAPQLAEARVVATPPGGGRPVTLTTLIHHQAGTR